MPFVHINNCKFYYETHGSGQDVVFVHGENQGIQYWEYQIPELSKRHRCLVYYRRGHGLTELADYGYSVENQTHDLAQLVEHFGIKAPVIVGVAFGTTIATNYAINFGDRLKGLVMIGWSELDGGRGNVDRWHKQTLQIVEILRTQGREALDDYIRNGDQSFIPILPSNPKIREKFIRMYTDRPAEGYVKRMEAVTSVPNLLSRLHEIKVPILAIHGEMDVMPDTLDITKRMPNFKEVVVPRAERFVHWEYPDQFNNLLEDFLGSLR